MGLIKSSGHELFSGCLTFPILKENGQIGEIYGRRFHADDPRISNPLYLPGPHQGIFNREAITNNQPLILCESIIDALSFWVHDFHNVTASFGSNGFTEEMQAFIDSKGIQHIIIAFDNDDAGNKATSRLVERWLKQKKQVSRVMLPKTMDINGFMLSEDDPKLGLST